MSALVRWPRWPSGREPSWDCGVHAVPDASPGRRFPDWSEILAGRCSLAERVGWKSACQGNSLAADSTLQSGSEGGVINEDYDSSVLPDQKTLPRVTASGVVWSAVSPGFLSTRLWSEDLRCPGFGNWNRPELKPRSHVELHSSHHAWSITGPTDGLLDLALAPKFMCSAILKHVSMMVLTGSLPIRYRFSAQAECRSLRT